MKVGVICYNSEHLKTEQVVQRLCDNDTIKKINLFALPFKKMKKRKVLFFHRPNQKEAVTAKELAKNKKVFFNHWDGKSYLNNCDIFIITGAGIINPKLTNGKPIINAHPGIIPLVRGLDSFKWAIFHGDSIGITLHIIDEEVDKGNILFIQKTQVFSDDNIFTLAKRHYQNEIDLLVNFQNFLTKDFNQIYPIKEPYLRMPLEIEKQLFDRFEAWKEKQLT